MNNNSELKIYMIFICPESSFKTPENLEPEVVDWVNETTRRGTRILGDRFRPISESKRVSVKNGQVTVTDLSEKDDLERIAGFDLLKCKDIDEAIKIASRHPMAKHGTIQVRQVWESK